MKTILLLALMFYPLVSFAITWEKEGIQTINTLKTLIQTTETTRDDSPSEIQNQKDNTNSVNPNNSSDNPLPQDNNQNNASSSSTSLTQQQQCGLIYFLSFVRIETIAPVIQKMSKEQLTVLGISGFFFFGTLATSISEMEDKEIETFIKSCIDSNILEEFH